MFRCSLLLASLSCGIRIIPAEQSCGAFCDEQSASNVLLLQGYASLGTKAASVSGTAPPGLPVHEDVSALDATTEPHFYHGGLNDTINLSVEFQFLHIGKTGGSTIHQEFQDAVDLDRTVMFGHNPTEVATRNCSERPNTKYIFFVRAPIARFISGWISRFVFGLEPDALYPVTPEEIESFKTFKSPDQLGCALGSTNATTREAALRSIHAIQHTRQDLNWYWHGIDNVRACHDQIFFVGRTEHLDEDVDDLASRLRAEHVLQNNITHLHVHSLSHQYDGLRELGPCAVQHLREYYRRDYDIIDYLASVGLLPASYPDEVESIDEPGRT